MRDWISTAGPLDLVIANAGVSAGTGGGFESPAQVRAVFDTNVGGVLNTVLPALEAMAAQPPAGPDGLRGRVAVIASVAAFVGVGGAASYCASKAGVISYCESLRGELRGTGVRVLTLCPGYVDTPLTQQNRYAMPFLMAPKDFARKAFAAVQSGARYRVIPWQMGVVAKAMRLLPDALFDRLLVGRPRKHRHGSER